MLNSEGLNLALELHGRHFTWESSIKKMIQYIFAHLVEGGKSKEEKPVWQLEIQMLVYEIPRNVRKCTGWNALECSLYVVNRIRIRIGLLDKKT